MVLVSSVQVEHFSGHESISKKKSLIPHDSLPAASSRVVVIRNVAVGALCGTVNSTAINYST